MFVAQTQIQRPKYRLHKWDYSILYCWLYPISILPSFSLWLLYWTMQPLSLSQTENSCCPLVFVHCCLKVSHSSTHTSHPHTSLDDAGCTSSLAWLPLSLCDEPTCSLQSFVSVTEKSQHLLYVDLRIGSAAVSVCCSCSAQPLWCRSAEWKPLVFSSHLSLIRAHFETFVSCWNRTSNTSLLLLKLPSKQTVPSVCMSFLWLMCQIHVSSSIYLGCPLLALATYPSCVLQFPNVIRSPN